MEQKSKSMQPYKSMTSCVRDEKLYIFLEAIKVEETVRFAYSLHLSLLPVVHDIAVQKKYNLVNAYIGKAGALKDLKKNDEYLATIKEGLKEVPGDKSLTKMYTTYYLNAGITAQKAGKTAAAEEAYKEILEVQKNNTNALYSLGALKYNDATKTLATDRDKAKTIYTEAKGYLESVAKLLTNPKQKAMLDNVNGMLKQIDIQLQAE